MIELEPNEFEHRGTLCYVLDAEEVLLIWKKRGIGSQQYNAPGGKIEPGDSSPVEAARREVEEELHIVVSELEHAGELAFIFGDSPFMYGYVFTTTSYHGTPVETEEARPAWFPIEEIPYGQMWEDDQYWMPLMFEGIHFRATFQFDSSGSTLEAWEITPST